MSFDHAFLGEHRQALCPAEACATREEAAGDDMPGRTVLLVAEKAVAGAVEDHEQLLLDGMQWRASAFRPTVVVDPRVHRPRHAESRPRR